MRNSYMSNDMTEIKTTRPYDSKCEKIVAKFLDDYFYSKYDYPIERIEDREMQLKGIDIKINNTILVDEKCKLYPVNEFIKCLSFELEFYSKYGQLLDGWFLNKNIITTHYNIITIFTLNDKQRIESIGDIDHLNLLFIDKQDLKGYVFSSTSEEQLQNDKNELRLREPNEYEQNGKCRKQYKHGKFWLVKSYSLKEQPINVVIPRTVLCSLKNSIEFEVSRTDITKVNSNTSPIEIQIGRNGKFGVKKNTH